MGATVCSLSEAGLPVTRFLPRRFTLYNAPSAKLSRFCSVDKHLGKGCHADADNKHFGGRRAFMKYLELLDTLSDFFRNL